MFFIIVAIFIFLITFLSANPNSRHFNKLYLNQFVPKQFRLDYKIITKHTSSISYPIIIKPIYCSAKNFGVQKISNSLELQCYFAQHKSKNQLFVAQPFHPTKHEVGILFEKLPFQKGNIVSIVSKTYNSPTNWRPRRCKTVINSGEKCHSRKDLMTKKLEDIFVTISNRIPNFYVGRYDVGFDDENDFKQGKNFVIYEINDLLAADLRAEITTLDITILPKLLLVCRWLIVRFLIGFCNIISGKTNLCETIASVPAFISEYYKCGWFGL